jgi:hypothetical protein
MPNVIEVSDFTGGFAPDGENASTPSDTLIDTHNLVPDRNTGSLLTRKGFRRLREELFGADTHYVRNIRHFHGDDGVNYLIVVLTTGTSAANNVRLYAIDLSNNSVQRIDTAGVNWDNPLEPHWGVGIDGIYYGGSKGNAMYSWTPSGPTWDADAATPSGVKTWVNAQNDSVTTATEYGSDYAFKGTERVLYSGDYYKPVTDLRYDDWESGEHYSVGDLVSLKAVWASTSSYYKSFKCIKAHTADSTNKPGVGTGTPATYWEKKRLSKPVDDEGSTNTDDWSFVPTAAETSIATWHGSRLFMRYDGQGDLSRLLYSAPVKPEKGANIADVVWDPTNFAPQDTVAGVGGGWLSFNDGKHQGNITALYSFGAYLVVFKRRAVWVISGQDDDTWTVRRLARGVGAVGPQARVELDGLLYFLSDDGLYVTDGTAVQPVQGNEKVEDWFRQRLDSQLQQAATDKLWPMLWQFNGFIWIAMPNSAASTNDYKFNTVVYDPDTGSFWPTDLPVCAVTTYRESGINKTAFGAPAGYSTRDLVYLYNKSNANDQDDTGLDTYAGADIPWRLRTAWWNFSTYRQDRRIRRVWAAVKSAVAVTITAYRNWSNTQVADTVDTPSQSSYVEHIEGEWFADSHAVSFKLSAEAAPATVVSIAVDTERRRVRYHRNS